MSSTSAQRLLRRAQYIPLLAAAVYALILILMMVPAVQDEFVFLHRLRFPYPSKYDNPEHHGLAPFKTRNLRLQTPDGESLGAWHILPQSYYVAQQPFPPRHPLQNGVFDAAFAARPTILYFHGNAATRAASHRVRGYIAMSTRLDCNVVAVDYRGFADSTGAPSERGLATDARTVWDWVAARAVGAGVGAHAVEGQIVLVGHSLGTGVASALAGQLAGEGVRPRAVALVAPFTSIPDLLSSFWLFGFIPLLTPLKSIAGAQDYFKKHVVQRFNSTEALSRTSSPTLIVHTVNDEIIPPTHGAALFDSLVAPNGTASAAAVQEVQYEGWGVVRYAEDAGGRDVVYWEGDTGGHNKVGWAEGTMDLIAWVADL